MCKWNVLFRSLDGGARLGDCRRFFIGSHTSAYDCYLPNATVASVANHWNTHTHTRARANIQKSNVIARSAAGIDDRTADGNDDVGFLAGHRCCFKYSTTSNRGVTGTHDISLLVGIVVVVSRITHLHRSTYDTGASLHTQTHTHECEFNQRIDCTIISILCAYVFICVVF